MSQEGRTVSHDPAPSTGGPQEAAGRYLEHLLATNRYYRDQWAHKADRHSSKGVNRTAVARVLMEYVDLAGEAVVENERQLLDRVRRALNGNPLEPRTVDWFVKAFNFDQEDEERLRDLLHEPHERAQRRDVLVGASDLPVRQHWHTLALHDLYVLGPDGFPIWFEELRIVEALRDGLESYEFTFDTPEVDLEGIWGGTPGPLVYSEGNWYRSNIRFSTPARRGEPKSLRYRLKFRYSEAPEPCFRRGARRRIDTVELRVQFDQACLPRKVWWCQWDEPGGPAVQQRSCNLDDYNQVASIHKALQRTYVGFCWDW